jgi:hypothetical protein
LSESEPDEFDGDPWDTSDFTTYRCDSVKVSHTSSNPIINPHEYEDDWDDSASVRIHCVTLDRENIFQPKSAHGDTVNLTASRMSCEVAQGNILKGHLDSGSQATTIPFFHLLSNHQKNSASFPCP